MTFLEYQNNLGDFLSTGTNRLPTSVRKLLVNLSRRFLLRRYDLSFGEATATINTVAGTRTYSLPTNFSRALDVYYVASGVRKPIDEKKGKEVFNALWPDPTVRGSPIDWVAFGGLLWVGPTPDAVYAITLDHYALPADLTQDADHTALDDVAWEAVLYGALTLSEGYMVEDERMATWAAQAKMFEEALQTEYRRAARSATRPESTEAG